MLPIKEESFSLEKEMQSLVEKNLDSLLNLEFVRSEFTVKNRRIDTLGYDAETKSFVIIEYKRTKNYSVVDQGMAYLQLMLDNKAEFIVEYNESLLARLKRTDVDWSQSRLVFVAPGFTQDQLEATNFKDLNINLLEIRRYGNGVINVTHHGASSKAPSFKEVAPKSITGQVVSKTIRSYTEDQHFRNGSEESLELYERLKAGILNFGDDLTMKPKKMEIGFMRTKVFCDVVIQKKAIKLYINLHKGNLDDPKGIALDVSKKGHWGNGDYMVVITDDTRLEYVLSLVKQGYLAH